ncbi:aminopeptidase [Oenococcus kitaharae]|uniref:Aminopeptidase S n=1 Tax=Oenococcus kitaharae DSM 17330 TaxID=1045004 RepID=G9WID4_9LACO|nr:aminopeptidase [Oenococcus kitaharae]EHN58946.1 Aminopeptidase S [Oenococcus kitaharae DSM 17330]OEY81739.1 peptidase [Oenococcus kitaharae]OEY83970.1 peptidase [Oenococcus kitaharae]OEY85674.1 peptidase [Oenococcus kitaharae]
MFPALNKQIDKFADLIIKKGAHVAPRQTVVIYSNTETDYFAEKLVKRAYQAGAVQVQVQWHNALETREFYLHASPAVISETPEYLKVWGDDLIGRKNATRISIMSDNPDNLSGIDPQVIANRRQALRPALKTVAQKTTADVISWLVVAAPSIAWAEKVFPDLHGQEAAERLWQEILKTVRISEDNDPIAEWDQHVAELKAHADWLTEQNFKELRYKSAKSDFTIGLAEHHRWEAASSVDQSGNPFIPNMPTEEVFTAPDNRHIDGTIASTLPLSYSGNLIRDIVLQVKNGQIVKAQASSGEAVLKDLIATDTGSHSFGEVSLVPFHSPINDAGVLFYNTLFDENASDHVAIGQAYNTNIQKGEELDERTLASYGWNQSDVHVDFMIGSSDMAIDGVTQDDRIIPVFRNGDWA